MVLRAIAIWFLLLAVAVANGALREGVISPRVGSRIGHVVSTLLLCAAIVLLAWLSLSWIAPVRASDAWAVGVLWAILTLAFEFLAGHYLFGNSWSDLLADYNVREGRIWPLVPLVTLLAPWLAFSFSEGR